MKGATYADHQHVLWHYRLHVRTGYEPASYAPFHVQYQEKKAVLAIPSGELLAGDLPANKMKLLQAWIEIHRDELVADWEIAAQGGEIFRIKPLD